MKTLLSWSTGKDSAWALHLLRQRDDVELVGLVTTINAAFDRVAMHGVRRALVEAQAEAAGLPLHVLPIPYPCPNETYEAVMGEFVARAGGGGVEAMAFGDLFLEDIRRYREAQARRHRHRAAVSAVGHRDREAGARHDRGGLVAHIACLDPRKLPASLAGRRFELDLLAELPAGVDPCAENGEFHTFASAGPMFRRPSPSASARPSPATASCSAIWCPLPMRSSRMGRGLG